MNDPETNRVPISEASPLDGQSEVRLLTFTVQQRTLLEALTELANELEPIYLGGLTVLEDSNNPDRYALCAHSFRELMEKLPRYLDVTTQAHRESLKDKVIGLEQAFYSTKSQTNCRSDKKSWEGEIDGHLANFLSQVDRFFKWFKSHFPRRREEIKTALTRLENSGKPLPPKLTDMIIKQWEGLRDYFVHVSHHRNTDESEIRRRITELEDFLLDRFAPRPFDDFAEIDALLREKADNA